MPNLCPESRSITYRKSLRQRTCGAPPATTLAITTLCLLAFSARAFAIGAPRYVESVFHPGDFALVEQGRAVPLRVDSNDYAGVVRAVTDLQGDVTRVTGRSPSILNEDESLGKRVVIIGTIGRSAVVDRLIHSGKLDVTSIAGKWESFVIQTITAPFPGVNSALVVAGSDKRGTIYGIYDVSEQIGVSPWYWWADVPVAHKDALFVKPGKHLQGPPAVKYRGIFLNDEAPSLTGWVKATYGNYNHQFYERVFELLLRLKANLLWPAMWNNAFNEDDPLNPKLADEYGIVMGTSHHEPMLRAQQEWKRHGTGSWDYSKNSDVLRAFWSEGIQRNKDYESIIALGMRGDGDMPMSRESNVELLEKIVADQRKIIANRMNRDVEKVPQVWALYKEVQEYYEKGMRVPDDVTLLWCDDNWGNIRRLPTPEERKRSGGAGIYYHFDYVGGPRSYKWLNTVPITKIREQMTLAYHYGADRIWIVNVGDLKPMEFPTEFFLKLAWEPEGLPKEELSEYTRRWAQREFGTAHGAEIASIVSKYTKYNGRRKPELLDSDTFSQVDYLEADTVAAKFEEIANRAEKIYNALPENARDAFFELVLYPAKASAIVTRLYVTVGKNRLYASQGRSSANDLAAEARALFKADADLANYYNHTLAHGKWVHMMDQTHIGYTFWNEPKTNVMPQVTEVETPATASMGVVVEGTASAWPGASGTPVLPVFDVFNQQRYYIDVFNRGSTPFAFSATTSAPWILLSASRGTVEKEQRLWVSVDWTNVPQGSSSGYVRITGAPPQHAKTARAGDPGAGGDISVNVNAFYPKSLSRDSLDGFVETNGYVSIEAEHYSSKTGSVSARWEKIDDYGRTLSSMTIVPDTAASILPPQASPCLEYEMYLFDSGTATVEAITAPTLNFVPGRGLRYAISFDEQPPQAIDVLADNSLKAWETAVKDSVRKTESAHSVRGAGYHTLKFCMVDSGLALQKLVVNMGGAKPSYLGPPESYRNPRVRSYFLSPFPLQRRAARAEQAK
jgi:hypothetical protein